jgi:hypothetical protein
MTVGILLRAFSDAEADALAARYRAGETLSALALDTGRGVTAVRNALKSRGVVMRRVGARVPARKEREP